MDKKRRQTSPLLLRMEPALREFIDEAYQKSALEIEKSSPGIGIKPAQFFRGALQEKAEKVLGVSFAQWAKRGK
jgi:hypothetical protein